MSIPLKKALKLGPISEGKVVVGEGDLDREVTGLTIMEAPDIVDWLNGGELILTSLYPIRQEPEKQRELVEKLYQKEIAGLVIKSHRFIEEIPEQVIKSARKNGLPIIELPGEIRFVDVMYPIMAELFNKQVSKLRFFKDVHESFTMLALEGKGFSSILNSLEQKLQNPVFLSDNDFNIIDSTDECINEFSFVDDENRSYINDYVYRKKAYYPGLEQELDQVIVPIKVANHLKAFLNVVEFSNSLEELDLITLEQARTVISLEMAKQSAVSEVAQRFKNDIINDLIMGKIESAKYFYERASLIGWDLEHAFIPIIFNIQNIDRLQMGDHIRDNLWIKDKISSIIRTVLEEYDDHYILGSRSNSIIVFWSADEKEEKEVIPEIKAIAEDVHSRVKKQFEKAVIATGIGTRAKELKQIAGSYDRAWEALSFGRKIYGEEMILSFSELGVYRLLCKFNENNSLQEYIPDSLQKLMDYDREHNTNLLATLEEFLRCNLNASQAAKNLYIHYKTMLYRLERIKKIGEVNLENYEDKLNIEIGLKILYLLGEI